MVPAAGRPSRVTVGGAERFERLPDGCALAEVERRAGNREDLAGRQELAVNRGVVRAHDPQLVVEHRSRGMSREVEVRVVDHVDDGRGVGDSLHRDPQRVAGELVRAAYRARAREPHVAVGALGPEGDRAAVRTRLDVPEPAVPATAAAVEVVPALVAVERVVPAEQRETAIPDPVAVSPHGGAEVVRPGGVRRHVGKAQDDVRAGTVPARDVQLGEPRAEVGQPCRDPVAAVEPEGPGGTAVNLAKGFLFDHPCPTCGPPSVRDGEPVGGARGRYPPSSWRIPLRGMATQSGRLFSS